MPLNQYECKNCKKTMEKLEFGNEMDIEKLCPDCNTPMIWLFPTDMHFKLKYNPKIDKVSWGNEGYARSQYWDEVKKQRANGKNVEVPEKK